jgi:hypothetical protein
METLYAKINAYGKVENVIVADAAFISKSFEPEAYVQTYSDANGDPDKFYNYATIGGAFVPEFKAFIDPQPFNSWILNDVFKWVAPVPVPDLSKSYVWDEPSLQWVPYVR